MLICSFEVQYKYDFSKLQTLLMIDININKVGKRQYTKIALVGGGSFATALAKMLSDNQNRVNWWMRDKDNVQYIKDFKHNRKYLSSVEINTRKCRPTTRLTKIVKEADVVILAVPAAFLESSLSKLTAKDFKDKIVASAIKGLVPIGGEKLVVAEYMKQYFGVEEDNIAVITGPCHAEEVAREKLSYLTVASTQEDTAKTVADLINCRYINTVISEDVYGTEYAAVLKNIYALASGICDGLGYGDNFQAVLISNAIQEIQRFIDKVYPIHRDVKDSSYLGDLLVTAYSNFSRNRTFGQMIGKGYTVQAVQMEMNMVAEGYYATSTIHSVNESLEVDMPILQAVYNTLYGNSAPSFEFRNLISKLS